MLRIKTILLAIILHLFIASSASAQTTTHPPSAATVVKAACAEAASTHRKAFIIFHASWCGWCHRMDSIIANPACKQLFADHYVIEHLVIMENGDKKALENPGARELYAKYAGPNGQGIPFWLVFDADGKVVADSRNKPAGVAADGTGNNVGCPSEPEEVAYFVKVLRATSKLTDGQIEVIRENFSEKN